VLRLLKDILKSSPKRDAGLPKSYYISGKAENLTAIGGSGSAIRARFHGVGFSGQNPNQALVE
jgi:hypothetical protein